MRRTLLYSLALATTLAAGGAASAQAPQSVEESLRKYYPSAQYTFRDSQTLNGVTVYDVDIRTPTGNTVASLNERGEFIYMGRPARVDEAPQAVRDAVSIFRQPQNFDELVVTYYYVQVAPPGREPYEVKLSGAGRVIDIRSQRQLRRVAGDAPTGAPITPEERRRAEEQARQEFRDARVTEIRRWNEAEGFTITEVETNGRRGSVILDRQGQVVSSRIELDPDSLPEPVRRSLGETFNADIRQAHQSRQKHYQLRQRVGDETLSMRIHFNGDVMDVRNERAGGDAVTAGARDGREPERFRGGSNRARDRDRDRR